MICQTCFRHCHLEEGQIGYCQARQRKNNQIVCRNYGQLTAIAMDPIEKKPLAMFHPGSQILSIGSYGCNLACPFCQNYQISKEGNPNETVFVAPEQLVQKAIQLHQIHSNMIGIAYTYNEMLCSWEYVRDVARLIHENNMVNVLVTNGNADIRILKELMPYIDAMNIDLKSFNERTYDQILHGNLKQVMDCIEYVYPKTHLEITTLVVPHMNDTEEEMEALAQWLRKINPNIPYHLSRYFPRWHMDTPATDIDWLYHLANIAKKHLNHVFIGNV